MSKKHESKWNIEDLSDLDIYNAIRYLEPDPIFRKQKDETAFVISVTVVILLLGCLGFMWLYLR